MNPSTQQPAQPIQPIQPTTPAQPTQPAQPIRPIQSTQPIQPPIAPSQSPIPSAISPSQPSFNPSAAPSAPITTPQPTPMMPPAPALPPQPTATPIATPIAPGVVTPPPPDAPLATQTAILISELRDGMVIMKDGSFRAVVACKSINFDLMSETEREGVEYSYQNFLNSLTFPTQILIRSQRVDIGPYLERLTDIRRNNDNMLLGVLMDDYINFIDILSQEANIMDKSFFIVIPYYWDPNAEKAVNQAKNFFSSLRKPKTQEVTKIDRQTYDKSTDEINRRVESVISGLFQIGIHSVRLNTKELSELYYNYNNPDTAVREPFIDFSRMATTYVKKGTKKEQ